MVLKRCKNCALNRPAATKAPLVPIITGQTWERAQIDLIDMSHEPSGQLKWILHVKKSLLKVHSIVPIKKHACRANFGCFRSIHWGILTFEDACLFYYGSTVSKSSMEIQDHHKHRAKLSRLMGSGDKTQSLGDG